MFPIGLEPWGRYFNGSLYGTFTDELPISHWKKTWKNHGFPVRIFPSSHGIPIALLRQKHSIFDEETCCTVDVQEPLAIALLEAMNAYGRMPFVGRWYKSGRTHLSMYQHYIYIYINTI